MRIEIKPYKTTPFKSGRNFIKVKKPKVSTLDVTVSALKANLLAFKVSVGSELVSYISNSLSKNGNTKTFLENRKYTNFDEAIEAKIKEVVSEKELRENPELQIIVARMKADILGDIADMYKSFSI